MVGQRRYWRYFAFFQLCLVIVFFGALFFLPPFYEGLIGRIHELKNDGYDGIGIAVQLGRLDIVSLSVAFLGIGVLGIGVGFFALFSFFQVREDAKESARKEAVTVARAEVRAYFESQLDEAVESILQRRDRRSGKIESPDTSRAELVNDGDQE